MIDLSPLQLEILHYLLLICFCSLVYCFVAGEMTRNNSQMDKLWSLLPPVYLWVAAAMGGFSFRLVVMAVLVTLWGARLTYNFGRKGAYSIKFWSGEEDYRWKFLRGTKYFQSKIVWGVFDLVFISFYQNLLVLMICLPAVLCAGDVQAFGTTDILATVLMAFFIGFETISDEQQWKFQTAKWKMINSGIRLEDLPEPYCTGFNTTGLWSVSRHPNYFAEQAIWLSFYVFSIGAGAGIINWSAAGAVLLVLLFIGSAWLGELISSSKYPAYTEYKKTVRKFIPLKKRV